MTYETPRDNSGALFKNTRKEAETHADYNGSVRVEGVDYYLNAWVKEGKSGKFFSLSLKRKNTEPAKRIPGDPRTPIDLDDAVPF